MGLCRCVASYTGEWAKGERQGAGTMMYVSGGSYTSQWAKDQKHGMGNMAFGAGACGVVYNGHFAFGAFDGQGLLTVDTCLCLWRPCNGFARPTMTDGRVLRFEGTWKQG